MITMIALSVAKCADTWNKAYKLPSRSVEMYFDMKNKLGAIVVKMDKIKNTAKDLIRICLDLVVSSSGGHTEIHVNQ